MGTAAATVKLRKLATLCRVRDNHEMIAGRVASRGCLDGELQALLNHATLDRSSKVEAPPDRTRRCEELIDCGEVHCLPLEKSQCAGERLGERRATTDRRSCTMLAARPFHLELG